MYTYYYIMYVKATGSSETRPERSYSGLCTVDAHHIENFFCCYSAVCWCSSRERCWPAEHRRPQCLVHIVTIVGNTRLAEESAWFAASPPTRMRIARCRSEKRTDLNTDSIDLTYYMYTCIIYRNYPWQPTLSWFQSRIAISVEKTPPMWR